MSKLRGWVSDLAVGVRLAVGGGRTSAARFALSTVGIAIAVAVLLLASSVDNIIEARHQRTAVSAPNPDPIPGVDPLHIISETTEFGGKYIPTMYLYPGGPKAPLPPGVPRLPTEDESFVSPALAEFLGTPSGERLRSRIPPVVGTIDPAAVTDPGDLALYIGADKGILTESVRRGPYTNRVYSFGGYGGSGPMDPGLLLLLLLGVVALLVPVFIFVAASSRIAGAERDRRLSALRLVGAGARQVRRIAAAESLVSALAGLLLGGAVFLVGRQFLDEIELFGVRVNPGDVAPAAWLVLLVVVAIPFLAVLTAQFALRRTIVEPLGVVRRQRPVRRRLLWRLALIGLGVLLLVTHGWTDSNDVRWSYAVAGGATLLLIGVPAMLPWLVERSVRRLRGGPASWQLAIRRLQSDGGTSARVVGGVAVVLAAAIALHIVLTAQEYRVGPTDPVVRVDPNAMMVVSAEPEIADAVTDAVRGVPGVRGTFSISPVDVRLPDGGMTGRVGTVSCADANRILDITDCVDGDVFDTYPAPNSPYRPGNRLTVTVWSNENGQEHEIGTWTVPTTVRPILKSERYPATPVEVLVTPGALRGITVPAMRPDILVEFDLPSQEVIESVRDVLAPFAWRTASYVYGDYIDGQSDDDRTFLAIRNGLLAGAMFVLLLAGLSLLTLALEQIRERRRALAVLSASGVPRAVLARSLLWQTVVPVVLGVVLAVIIGFGLAVLALRLTGFSVIGFQLASEVLIVDWATIGLLCGVAILLGLLTTALTLPFLRSASRLESLRTE